MVPFLCFIWDNFLKGFLNHIFFPLDYNSTSYSQGQNFTWFAAFKCPLLKKWISIPHPFLYWHENEKGEEEVRTVPFSTMYTTILLIPLSGASMLRPRLLEVTVLLQLLLKLVSLSSSWPLVPSSCLSSCSFPWHIARHAAYGTTTILLIKILLIKILLPVAIFQSFQYKSEFFEDVWGYYQYE